jgi:nucleoside 2-deoxyribosyltransferase
MNGKPLVYLAGPITGLSYGASTDWRAQVEVNIDSQVELLSPMRHKDYLKGETAIAASYESHVMSCANGITARDRFDCMRADLVFVNFLGATKLSAGTIMEIAWADAQRTPIVVVMEDDNVHRHPMISEAAGFIVESLEKGITVVERILLAKLGTDSLTVRLANGGQMRALPAPAKAA